MTRVEVHRQQTKNWKKRYPEKLKAQQKRYREKQKRKKLEQSNN